MDTESNFFGDQDDGELEDIIESRGEDVEEEDEDYDRRRGDDEAEEAPAPKKKDGKGPQSILQIHNRHVNLK